MRAGTATSSYVNGEELVYGVESGVDLSYGADVRVIGGQLVGGRALPGAMVYMTGGSIDGINGYAAQLIVSGGVVSGLALSGGSLTMSSGTLDGATLTSATAYLLGGVVSGGLTLSSGTAIISAAVASGATISFAGGGDALELANVSIFAGQIAGMTNSSQKLDLTQFAYTSGETVSWAGAAGGTSGVLTISDGAEVAHLNLVGAYVTSNFVLSSDGASGTIVVDPPVAAFAQAMATFHGHAAAGLLASSVSGAAMLASPIAAATSGPVHG